jgi:hypothetical protein
MENFLQYRFDGWSSRFCRRRRFIKREIIVARLLNIEAKKNFPAQPTKRTFLIEFPFNFPHGVDVFSLERNALSDLQVALPFICRSTNPLDN